MSEKDLPRSPSTDENRGTRSDSEHRIAELRSRIRKLTVLLDQAKMAGDWRRVWKLDSAREKLTEELCKIIDAPTKKKRGKKARMKKGGKVRSSMLVSRANSPAKAAPPRAVRSVSSGGLPGTGKKK